jgi:hypothetical protein
MLRRSLTLIALTAFVSAAAATQAMACCGCAYTCAPPAPVQIWGLSPSFGINQGPVYSGPGYYTSPTNEGETSTIDYPYVGYGDYQRHDYPPYEYPYSEPFRRRIYHPYWQSTLPGRPRHFGTFYRHQTSVLYRHGFGPRAVTMSGAERFESRDHRDLHEPRYR